MTKELDYWDEALDEDHRAIEVPRHCDDPHIEHVPEEESPGVPLSMRRAWVSKHRASVARVRVEHVRRAAGAVALTERYESNHAIVSDEGAHTA